MFRKLTGNKLKPLKPLPTLNRNLSLEFLTRKPLEEFDEEYEVLHQLGEGASGVVWLVKRKRGGQKMAMKTLNLDELNGQVEDLKREVELLEQMDHPNIVRLIEVYESDKLLKLIMDYCKGGDLLQAQKLRLRGERDVSCVIFQILSALEYIHSRGMIHGDVKLENVLFVEEDVSSRHVALIDFGYSERVKTLKGKPKKREFFGTLLYLAPELLQGVKSGIEVDLWAMGVLIFILLTGRPPFIGQDEDEIYQAIKMGKVDYTSPMWQRLSPDAKVLTEHLLVQDLKNRWTCKQALQSGWFTNSKQDLALHNDSRLEARVVRSLIEFTRYSTLKKISLMSCTLKTEGDSLSKLRAIFSSLDKDNDSVISASELTTFVKLNSSLSDEDATRIFLGLDIDRSGKVQLSEFIAASLEAIMNITESHYLESFEFLAKRETHITATNVEKILGIANCEYVKSYFVSIGHANGKLNRDEFLFLLKKEDYEKQLSALPNLMESFRMEKAEEENKQE